MNQTDDYMEFEISSMVIGLVHYAEVDAHIAAIVKSKFSNNLSSEILTSFNKWRPAI